MTEKIDSESPKRRKGREPPKPKIRLMGFGVELAGVMALFGWGGYWADQKLGHSWPWLMSGGLIVAFVGMMYRLFKETADWRK